MIKIQHCQVASRVGATFTVTGPYTLPDTWTKARAAITGIDGAKFVASPEPHIPWEEVFTVGTTYKVERVEGNYAYVSIVSTNNNVGIISGGKGMEGAVYDGVVVRTRTGAVEGTACCTKRSEVVFATTVGFVAPSDEAAKQIVVAQALGGKKLTAEDLADTAAPIEVKLRKWA